MSRGLAAHRPFPHQRPQLEHLPAFDLPEIAFVGRSNAGKSTAINTLTQQTRLAFASKTPGRTQHINLFGLGKQKVDDAVLADLPGYGYAAVPREAKLRWQRVMGNYLITRENLRGVVLMCDPRHGMTELDEILLEVIRPRVEQGLKFLILLTKSDKLTRSDGAKALSIMRLQAGGGEVKLFSALKKQGVDEAAELLWRWAHPKAPRRRRHRSAGGPPPTTGDRPHDRDLPAHAAQRHHAQLPRQRHARPPADGCSCTASPKAPSSGTNCWSTSRSRPMAASAASRPTCAASSSPAHHPPSRTTAPTCWCRTSASSLPRRAPTASSTRWWRTTGAAPSAGGFANAFPQQLRRLVILNSPHPGTFARELRENPAQQKASAYMHFLARPDAPALLAENDYRRMWPFFTAMGAGAERFGWLTEPVEDQYRALWTAGLRGACNLYAVTP